MPRSESLASLESQEKGELEHIHRHIGEKNHDDWKYSIDSTVGPADNRYSIKIRGDDLTQVLKEVNQAKKAVME
jgi:hypothetical protein